MPNEIIVQSEAASSQKHRHTFVQYRFLLARRVNENLSLSILSGFETHFHRRLSSLVPVAKERDSVVVFVVKDTP